MGSDLYTILVTHWREDSLDAMVTSASEQGLPAAETRACLLRAGPCTRVIEFDVNIHQIHPDAPIFDLTPAFVVHMLREAHYENDACIPLRDRLDELYDGFDSINNDAFLPGPREACFAFRVLEQGSDPGDPADYGDGTEPAPDETWLIARIWIAKELGNALQGMHFRSRAWGGWGSITWMNLFPPPPPIAALSSPLQFEPLAGSTDRSANVNTALPTENSLLVLREENGECITYDLSTAREVQRLSSITEKDTCFGASWSTDRNFLVIETGSGVRVFDRQGTLLHERRNTAGLSEWGMDAQQHLIEARFGGEEAAVIAVYEGLSSNTLVQRFEHQLITDGSSYNEFVDWCLARTAPLGASSIGPDLLLWNTSTGKVEVLPLPAGETVRSICFSPTETRLFVCTNRAILAWNIEQRAFTFRMESALCAESWMICETSSDDVLLLSKGGAVFAIHLPTQVIVAELIPRKYYRDGLASSVQWDSTYRVLSFVSDGKFVYAARVV